MILSIHTCILESLKIPALNIRELMEHQKLSSLCSMLKILLFCGHRVGFWYPRELWWATLWLQQQSAIKAWMKLWLFNTTQSAAVKVGNAGGCIGKYNSCILQCWKISCGTNFLDKVAHSNKYCFSDFYFMVWLEVSKVQRGHLPLHSAGKSEAQYLILSRKTITSSLNISSACELGVCEKAKIWSKRWTADLKLSDPSWQYTIFYEACKIYWCETLGR